MTLSPRMRGCFHHQLLLPKGNPAFPAYAGMFPLAEPSGSVTDSFPRVCGDVSKEIYAQGTADELSPRMRGCFLVPVTPRYLRGAFPAYAGMFLRPLRLQIQLLGFPRVCGDVSALGLDVSKSAQLSPRMRGCFYVNSISACFSLAFPAYAGMFPSAE